MIQSVEWSDPVWLWALNDFFSFHEWEAFKFEYSVHINFLWNISFF